MSERSICECIDFYVPTGNKPGGPELTLDFEKRTISSNTPMLFKRSQEGDGFKFELGSFLAGTSEQHEAHDNWETGDEQIPIPDGCKLVELLLAGRAYFQVSMLERWIYFPSYRQLPGEYVPIDLLERGAALRVVVNRGR